jgi:CelD/BcsL family acetyltransferase involved in cellulose biosynthesis
MGSKIIVDAERKARRLSRDVGPLRFVSNDVAPATFRQLLDWKNAQFQRTGAQSPFGFGWIRELVDDLREISEPTFGGLLSALWAGDMLLAIHFGMRSKKTWHYWFPTYNPAYGDYSPGLILIQQMAAHAAELGVDTIELGKGDYLFKQRFSTSTIGVARAIVGPRSSLVTALRWRETVQRHAARWHLPLVASGLGRLSRRLERLVLS